MKKAKDLTARIFPVLLSLILVMGMAATAGATDTDGVQTVPYSKTSDSDPEADNATITISNAATGVTYKLYRLFSATVSADDKSIVYDGTIPSNNSGESGYNLGDYFEIDSYGHVANKAAALDGTEMSDGLKTALANWTKDSSTTALITGASTSASTLEFTNLPYGYYVVTTSLDSIPIIVTSTKPDATIEDKSNVTPSENGTNAFKTVATDDVNVAIGDKATFTIQFSSVNYANKTDAVTSYTITDTPKNLAIDKESVKVTIGGTEVTAPTYDENGNQTVAGSYTVAIDSNTGIMTITIPWATEIKDGDDVTGYNFKYTAYSPVVITYEAEVLSGAVTKTDDNAGASNTAKITYTTGGTDVTLNDGGTTVDLNIADFQLKKVNAQNELLSGAEFTITKQNENDPIKFVAEKDDDGNITAYHVADSVEKADDNVTKVTTIVAGDVTIKGLDLDEEYTLTETKAPTGYNKLSTGIALKAVNDEDSVKIEGDLDSGVTTNYSTTSLSAADFQDLVVVNTTGTLLPDTGGIGTTIFYAVGGTMVVAAVVLLIAKKRAGLED